MAAISWVPQLETGIEVIDKQHRRWVEIYNALDAAVQAGREEDALTKALTDLVEYSRYHFRTEEALMERASYDEEEFDLHRREHKVFTDQVVIYQDRATAGFQKLTPQVMAYLRDWLLAHVTGTDRGYITPLREAGIA
ncbi:MAG: hemerythrin family protein [Deltaproteobacteria bacterium]|nr:hemerythrin family protein [Deltaproteobacteria bacterium]